MWINHRRSEGSLSELRTEAGETQTHETQMKIHAETPRTCSRDTVCQEKGDTGALSLPHGAYAALKQAAVNKRE